MSTENKQLQGLQNAGLVEIEPYDTTLTDDRFHRIKLSKSQQAQMSALYAQLPTIAASNALSNAYVLRFPEGISGTLMHYKNRGVGTPIIGENGIVAHASLYELSKEAALLNGFSALSVITGQYFLSEINNKFELINKKLDEILGFLYGEKKAELISEVNYVQNAYKNYASIMAHESQRIATVVGLQAAKKVAMKDVEFYMSDLDTKGSTDTNDYNELKNLCDQVLQIKESLDLAIQLYVMSSLMECYFAQNDDQEYMFNIEDELVYYIRKCDNRVRGVLNILKGRNGAYKPKLMEKVDTAPLSIKLDEIIKPLESGEESQMQKTIKQALDSSTKVKEYYLKADGSVLIPA